MAMTGRASALVTLTKRVAHEVGMFYVVNVLCIEASFDEELLSSGRPEDGKKVRLHFSRTAENATGRVVATS
ncbi:hypothetical protein Taro_015460 [Colocasia esculenta]|uniref:Uncharacterized protein n=1 Tax=Colocasia esculenta TaxID=4460 RepID=A0A843UKV8_COLES|nr:hypothetical protein [Colocasia esculenta]